ncbi:MAG: universal stress protein [Phenylobacterium sp.]|uniref:universal stress protein n=1 Tax=Phenylobacterium sp. TaxID=1871053 RepID=UPI0027341420|nr:universal stress protein [Phenylobacterium sp.]MDP3173988.1 universal stress protein [Phenylobacterium sp.]
MVEENLPNTQPKRILLATDLSGRGDRALDRAIQLSNQWDAELLIVHALEGDGLTSPEHQGLPSWRRPPNSIALVEAQIRDDVRENCPRLRIHVEEGPAIKVILDAIAREKCDLAVVGLGRYRSLGWPPLGKTIDELFRRAPISVLVVKKRPRGPYGHMLVGADFTPEARFGLETAAAYFPEAHVAVMNAFEMPYRALMMDTQLARDFGAMEDATLREFTDGAQLPDGARARLTTLVEHGPPEVMLSTYIMEQGADLTVIGAYERSRIFHAMIGGKGPRIVEAVPSDVLVVRAQRDAETS